MIKPRPENRAPHQFPGPKGEPCDVLDRALPLLSLPGLTARAGAWLDRHGRVLVILVPYAWLLVFFLIPFLITLKGTSKNTIFWPSAPPQAIDFPFDHDRAAEFFEVPSS